MGQLPGTLGGKSPVNMENNPPMLHSAILQHWNIPSYYMQKITGGGDSPVLILPQRYMLTFLHIGAIIHNVRCNRGDYHPPH